MLSTTRSQSGRLRTKNQLPGIRTSWPRLSPRSSNLLTRASAQKTEFYLPKKEGKINCSKNCLFNRKWSQTSKVCHTQREELVRWNSVSLTDREGCQVTKLNLWPESQARTDPLLSTRRSRPEVSMKKRISCKLKTWTCKDSPPKVEFNSETRPSQWLLELQAPLRTSTPWIRDTRCLNLSSVMREKAKTSK